MESLDSTNCAGSESGRLVAPGERSSGTWSAKYGETHRMRRIIELPAGIAGPKRVRMYARRDHYILQWWDPAAKQNLSCRVNGDLIAAVARARDLETQLEQFRTAGQRGLRTTHAELVAAYLAEQESRVNAGEIAPGTVVRYRHALRYYVDFVSRREISAPYPYAARVDRPFQLLLAQFLNGRRMGRQHANPLANPGYVEDTVRAMFAWGANPHEGGLLPGGFVNPFVRHARSRRGQVRDLLAPPDITLEMAQAFIATCDRQQLRLFAPLICYGLRAAKPCWLCWEHVDDHWLRVPCIAGLDYWTKGRQEKRFPLLKPIERLFHQGTGRQVGLIYGRRPRGLSVQRPLKLAASLEELIDAYQRRVQSASAATAAERLKIRIQFLRENNALNYDHVEGEFRQVAKKLAWPAAATTKDFRHLFQTLLQNAGLPEVYRRYLLGHSLGRSALINYTHLDELRDHYLCAVDTKLRPVINAIERRASQLAAAPEAA